jgi:hypothetical protein
MLFAQDTFKRLFTGAVEKIWVLGAYAADEKNLVKRMNSDGGRKRKRP